MDDTETKGTFLTALYTQLQAHNLFLRERMFQITTAALTILLVVDGWVLSASNKTTQPQKALLLAGILLVGIAATYSVRSHYREYLASAAMIVKCERAMGAYDVGRFLKGESLYAQESQAWGSGKYSDHLVRTYIGLLFAFSLFSCTTVILV